jgi:hypothetical protein
MAVDKPKEKGGLGHSCHYAHFDICGVGYFEKLAWGNL